MAITTDSFDGTRLVVEFMTTSCNAMPWNDKVRLWWNNVVFRTVPLGVTGLDIRVSPRARAHRDDIGKAGNDVSSVRAQGYGLDQKPGLTGLREGIRGAQQVVSFALRVTKQPICLVYTYTLFNTISCVSYILNQRPNQSPDLFRKNFQYNAGLLLHEQSVKARQSGRFVAFDVHLDQIDDPESGISRIVAYLSALNSKLSSGRRGSLLGYANKSRAPMSQHKNARQ